MVDMENLKSEYINEISKIKVAAKDLIKNKVAIQTIKTEVYLQQIYGDKISNKAKEINDFGDSQKSIKKITEDDIGMGSNIKAICDQIDSSKFDENLEMIMR